MSVRISPGDANVRFSYLYLWISHDQILKSYMHNTCSSKKKFWMTSPTTVTHKVCLPSAILPCVQRWVQIDIMNYRRTDGWILDEWDLKMILCKWCWINEVWIFIEKVLLFERKRKNIFEWVFGFALCKRKLDPMQICWISEAWNIDIFLARKLFKEV